MKHCVGSRRALDMNSRGAFLHVPADAGVSAAVVIGGFLSNMTGLPWIDPAMNLVAVIVDAVLAGRAVDSLFLQFEFVGAHGAHKF